MYQSKCYVKMTRSHNLHCVFILRCQRQYVCGLSVQPSACTFIHLFWGLFFFHYKKSQWLNKELRRINLLKVTEAPKTLFFLGYNSLNFILFWWQHCTQIKWNIRLWKSKIVAFYFQSQLYCDFIMFFTVVAVVQVTQEQTGSVWTHL